MSIVAKIVISINSKIGKFLQYFPAMARAILAVHRRQLQVRVHRHHHRHIIKVQHVEYLLILIKVFYY